MIPYPVGYEMRATLSLHSNSSRTKTSVEGVSVLQSQTTIHVATIPNHEAVISFWGETRGQLICNCYPQFVCSNYFQIIILVDPVLDPPLSCEIIGYRVMVLGEVTVGFGPRTGYLGSDPHFDPPHVG